MKKRSLFVATAMLLVAVLVATGATYAWFQSLGSAKTTISMNVANGDSLEISATGEAWVSTLTQADFTSLNGKIWTDLSTVDCETFFSEEYPTDAEGNITSINPDAFVEDGSVASILVYIRSSKTGMVKLTSTLDAGANSLLNPTLRMGVKAKDAAAATIYSTTGTAYKGVKDDIENTDAAYGDVAPVIIAGEKDLYDLTAADQQSDGYYYTAATFYFWIEGTQCTNAMIAEAAEQAVASLTFAQ